MIKQAEEIDKLKPGEWSQQITQSVLLWEKDLENMKEKLRENKNKMRKSASTKRIFPTNGNVLNSHTRQVTALLDVTGLTVLQSVHQRKVVRMAKKSTQRDNGWGFSLTERQQYLF